MVLGAATGPPWGRPLLILLMICMVQLNAAQEGTYMTNVTTVTSLPRATSEGHSGITRGTTQSSDRSTTGSTAGTSPPRTTREGTTRSSDSSRSTTGSTAGTYVTNVTTVTSLPRATSEGHSGITRGTTQSSDRSTTGSTAGGGTTPPRTTNEGTTQSSDSSRSTTGSTAGGDRLNCLQHTDCPPFSSCVDDGGHLVCVCDVGCYFHAGLGCVVAKTFPARVSLPVLSQDHDPSSKWLPAERVRDLFQVALGGADGYLSTAVTAVDPAGGHAVLLHYFSTLSSVTAQDLENELIHSSLLCANSSCVFSTDSYHSVSLCELEICDPSSTVCLWRDGLASCDCQEGYYQFHAGDRSCTACPSGFRWKDGRCLRCPFGFSGFNCEEPFLLTVVIESCVGCVLLVLFFTLLHSYIRRKKPTKPSLMDSVIRGAPSDEHIIRLPRAQFSWRNNWEWEEPPVSQMASTPPDKDPVLEFPEIRLKTFGDSPRAAVSSPQRGSHNLAFISDN